MSRALAKSVLDTLAETAVLLTSELVTNAVLHARTEIDLILTIRENLIRVEVWDHDSTEPEKHDPDDEDTSGRGLLLVEAMASAWGVRAHREGKCVWFEVAA